MKKRIEVSLWLVVASVSLNVLLGVGIIVALLVPLAKTAVMPTAIATALPTATATVTATRVVPTATMTALPTATPVPCGQNEVPGVDCSIDVGGLAVKVVSQGRTMVVYDSSGQERAPKDDYEWLVIHLNLPAWTVKADLTPWFEDGQMHAPVIKDAVGTIYNVRGAGGNNIEGAYVLELVFEVPKNAEGLVLIIQPGDEVDLSLVPDVTVAVMETPAPGASSEPSVTETPPYGQQ